MPIPRGKWSAGTHAGSGLFLQRPQPRCTGLHHAVRAQFERRGKKRCRARREEKPHSKPDRDRSGIKKPVELTFPRQKSMSPMEKTAHTNFPVFGRKSILSPSCMPVPPLARRGCYRRNRLCPKGIPAREGESTGRRRMQKTEAGIRNETWRAGKWWGDYSWSIPAFAGSGRKAGRRSR